MSESQHICGTPASKIDIHDVWATLRAEAEGITTSEPQLAHLVDDVILSRSSFAEALGARLSRRLAREDMPRHNMEPMLTGVFQNHPQAVNSAVRDLLAMFERDPACFSPLEPRLFLK